jgi:hypothetical protein
LALIAAGLEREVAADDVGGPSAQPELSYKMPPYFVREHNGKPWYYGSAPGFEFLSRVSSRGVAADFAGNFLRQEAMLAALLPPSLQPEAGPPESVILIPPDLEKMMEMEVARDMNATPWPQLGLEDPYRESRGLVLVLKDEDYSHISLTNAHVLNLLNARVPALPVWFSFGTLRLYSEINWFEPERDKIIPPIDWLSPSAARAIRKNPSSPRTLLPLEQIFLQPPPVEGIDPPEHYNLWFAELSLFMNWAFDGHREALWRFADRASREPVTETVLQDCFGVGFAGLGEELKAYLPTALAQPLVLLKRGSVPAAPFRFRDATPAEVARIQGDWTRKEIAYVREEYPQSVASYIAHAERVLVGPREEDGLQDPAFLAVLGLYYVCDVNDERTGRPLLETAVAAHVARPNAYIELARIRYEEARANPAGPGGTLGPGQVSSILDLLRGNPAAFEQIRTLKLVVDTLSHGAGPSVPADLALLDEGIGFFPKNPGLRLVAAELYARAGAKDAALERVRQGLSLAPDPGMSRRLLGLQQQLR